jgi:hypothetical protein
MGWCSEGSSSYYSSCGEGRRGVNGSTAGAAGGRGGRFNASAGSFPHGRHGGLRGSSNAARRSKCSKCSCRGQGIDSTAGNSLCAHPLAWENIIIIMFHGGSCASGGPRGSSNAARRSNRGGEVAGRAECSCKRMRKLESGGVEVVPHWAVGLAAARKKK